MERVLSWTEWTEWSVVWDGWVSSNHRCGQWRRTKVTETDGWDNLASPHKTRCPHHAVALFTDATATYVTRKRAPFSRSSKIQKHHIISQLIKAEKNRRTHLESGGELVSKYLLAQTEPAAWGTGHLSGNALESLVWRNGSRVGRRHTQTMAKTQTQHTFQCNDNGLLLRLKEQNTTDCTYIWFWCNVDHPKTYKIPADWSEALQNK